MDEIERLPDMEPHFIVAAGFAEAPPDDPDSLALAIELCYPDEEVHEWGAYLVTIEAAAALIAALYVSAERTKNTTRLKAMIDQCQSLWREVPD